MASKSKRAQMSPARNMSRAFMYWAIAVFIVKVLMLQFLFFIIFFNGEL